MCLVLLGEHLGKPRAGRAADGSLKPAPGGPQTEEAVMNWSDFYLICFFVGFGLSALALLAGSVHLHLPHLHLTAGRISTCQRRRHARADAVV